MQQFLNLFRLWILCRHLQTDLYISPSTVTNIFKTLKESKFTQFKNTRLIPEVIAVVSDLSLFKD